MRRITALLLVTAMLSACASFNENRKQSALFEATFYYEKAIRWADYATADKMRRPDDSSPRPAILERIKVTSYRQISNRELPDNTGMVITVKIDYYHNDTLKVLSIMDEQVWKYDTDSTSWYITTPLPAFR